MVDNDAQKSHFEILYQGKPSLKLVNTNGISGEREVFPYIGLNDFGSGIGEMGVGILTTNPDNGERNSLFWGLLLPHDLITSWRATRIVEHLPKIEHGSLADSFYAAKRYPHPSDQERTDTIISQIGQETHAGIMREYIPDEIINKLFELSNQESPDKALDLSVVTEEIDTETIDWEEGFSQIGIRHPSDVKKEAERQEAIIKRFEKHLRSYARRSSLTRDCMGMQQLESALLTAAGLGIDVKYGDDVAMGAAVVIGDAYTHQFVSMLMPGFGAPPEGYIEDQRAKKIAEASEWLTGEFSRRAGFREKFRSIPMHTSAEYRQLLEQVEAEWPRASTS